MLTDEILDIRSFILAAWPSLLSYGLILFKAGLIFIIGSWLSRWVIKLIRKALLSVPQLDKTLANFIPNLVRYLFWLVMFIAIIGAFGVETSSILTLIGAAGLAIGLALQGTLQNIAAGIMLLLLRPFKVEDYIEAGQVAGTVQVIGLFSCELVSAKGHYISVPNSSLWNVPILNLSRGQKIRLDIDFGLSYQSDMMAGIVALQGLLAEDELVEADPPPTVLLAELGENAVILRMRFWVKAAEQWTAVFHFNLRGRQVLEQAGCSFAFPQRDVRLFTMNHTETDLDKGR